MQFGTKKSDVVDGQMNDGEFLPYLRNFREGDNEVRFIEEVDDWTAFAEHYTPEAKSFPCTGDRNTCPGCTSDNEKMARASRKYATNVKLVQNDMVLPFRIPMSLAKKLFNRAERNGSITNRDYIVMREGKGLDTEYDLEQGDKSEANLAELRGKSHDIESILKTSYEEVWGDINDKPKKKEVAQEPVQEEKPPFDASGDVEIDEATLRAMSRSDLIALAASNSITVDEDGSKGEILDTILASAE
jgi:hypothetical protein